jgi:hypothetical protein
MTAEKHSAEALREVLASIEAGTLDATLRERAYIAGALHGLSGEAEADRSPSVDEPLY